MFEALKTLFTLIAQGYEFPDACSKAAIQHKVDYDALRDAYDDECSKF